MKTLNNLLLLPALLLLPVIIFSRVQDPVAPNVVAAHNSSETWVGVAVPSALVQLGCEQDGAIADVPVREGARVVKGAVLFKLTTRVQELEVARLKLAVDSDALVRRAKAELAFAEREEKRAKELHDKGMKGDADFDAAVRDAEIKRVEFEQAKQEQQGAVLRWQQEKARLEQRIVRSPIHGYVARLHYQKGDTVNKLEPIAEVVRLDPLYVEFDCPVEDADLLHEGALLRVYQEGQPDEAREAHVVNASRTLDAASQTFRVRLQIKNQDERWRAGVKVMVVKSAKKRGK